MFRSLGFVRNAALVSGGTLIEYGLGFLAGIIIARSLGPEQFGQYSYIVWLSGLLVLFINGPLPTTLLKFVPELRVKSPALTRALSRWALRVHYFAFCIIAIAFSIVLWIGLPAALEAAPVHLAALCLITAYWRSRFRMFVGVSQGFEVFTLEALVLIGTSLLTLLAVGIVALVMPSMVSFLAVFVAASGLQWAWGAQTLKRVMPPKPVLHAANTVLPSEVQQRIRRHALVSAVFCLLMAAQGRIVEFHLLQKYASFEALAFFSISLALGKALVDLVSAGLNNTLAPALARIDARGGVEASAQVLVDSTRLFLLIGITAGVVATSIANFAVVVLYGTAYSEAGSGLILTFSSAFLSIAAIPSMAFLMTRDQQSDRIRIGFIGLVLNIGVGVLTIPYFGLLGAVITFCAVSIATSSLSILFAYRRAGQKSSEFFADRLFLVCVPLTAFAVCIAHLSSNSLLIGPIGAFLLVLSLPITLAVAKVLRVEEYQLVARMVRDLSPRFSAIGQAIDQFGRRYGKH